MKLYKNGIDLTLRAAVYVVLGMAIFFLLFTWAAGAFERGPSEAFSETECRASVEWRSYTDVSIFDVESPLPWECQTKTIFLKYDETGRKKDENLITTSPTYYIGKKDAKKAMNIFAESLAKCLWQMGDGERDPFGTSERRRCVICYDIIVDKDVVDSEKGNIQVLANFQNYLESNKFSKTNEFYASYLALSGKGITLDDPEYWANPEKKGGKFSDIKLADESGNPISYTVYFVNKQLTRTAEAREEAGKDVTYILGYAYGFIKGDTRFWYLGLDPIYEIDSKCQGMF
jgi:hypothetical protein